jgi:hypothetical protein
MAAGEIIIYEPAGVPDTKERRLAPRPRDLRGKVVGVRVDRTWMSFDLVMKRVEERLRTEYGVADILRYYHKGQVGQMAREGDKERDEFAKKVDIAIVGLAA